MSITNYRTTYHLIAQRVTEVATEEDRGAFLDQLNAFAAEDGEHRDHDIVATHLTRDYLMALVAVREDDPEPPAEPEAASTSEAAPPPSAAVDTVPAPDASPSAPVPPAEAAPVVAVVTENPGTPAGTAAATETTPAAGSV